MNIALFGDMQGHRSIALAVQQGLEGRHTVYRLRKKKELIENLYTPLYLFFPPLHQIPFQLGKFEQSQKIFSDFLRQQYSDSTRTFVQESKADILINTHLIYTPILEDIKRETGIPLINIIADPRSIHPVLMSKESDVNLVFDEWSRQFCLESFPGNTVEPLGWLIRDEFEMPYVQSEVRRELGLDPSLFTMLIASGSEGTTMIMKILPALFTSPQNIQVIVACGGNATLLKSMQALAKFFAQSNKTSTLIPLGFTNEMHRYMQASDIVVGKAGPNTLFETVATLTPFFAITHIAGQESGNLDLITDSNLGYVEENPIKATKLLHDIIGQPEQLKSFAPSLEKMATYNRQAKPRLLRHVQRLLGQE